MRTELRLAGEGGQGLMTAAIIFAGAAAEHTDLNAIQTQSYGPESRGGSSKADVIIADEDIDYPEVDRPHFMVIMAQEACDKFAPTIAKGGTLIVDSTYVKSVPELDARVVKFPITEKARELGREIVANIVALGLLTGLVGVIPEDAVAKSLLARIPKGTEELNKKAFQAGLEASRAVS
jgi:2-oxoglutarate ferredoxin oxidoreductase subunit gamma